MSETVNEHNPNQLRLFDPWQYAVLRVFLLDKAEVRIVPINKIGEVMTDGTPNKPAAA